MKFKDRTEAGAQLARSLEQYGSQNIIVVGLPRGGVVPAAEIARHLGAPLDIIVTRKITHPLSAEYAVGAVAETGEAVWGSAGGLDAPAVVWGLDSAAAMQRRARRMRQQYAPGSRPGPLAGKTVIIVDDGLATGLTMEAAVRDARRREAEKIVVAAPVASPSALRRLDGIVDELIILHTPAYGFAAVAQYYDRFEPVDATAVERLLQPHRSNDVLEPLDTESLEAVLATIDHYPVSSAEVAKRAKELGAPESLIHFFESIPGGTTFADKQDVIDRSLVTSVIEEAERTEPDERVYLGD